MTKSRWATAALLAFLGVAVGAGVAAGATGGPRSAMGKGKEGDRAKLPDGWAAYTSGRGVIWSPLRQYKPQVVPGTENDRVGELEISDDGNWLLYVTSAQLPRGSTERSARLVLVRRDGSGYMQFRPGGFDEEDVGGGHCAGFFRNSPMTKSAKGICEIWYTCSPTSMRAAMVDLSGSKPVVGKDREILRVGDARKGVSGSTNGDLGYSVSSGRMWGGRKIITIPDGGRGVATDQTVVEGYSGCGHALSHDGDLAVQNGPADRGMSTELLRAAGEGNLPRGHSGFLMGHFYEGPRRSISQFFVTDGAAICLAPVTEEEFHDYNFSNDKNYLICRKTTKGGNGANPSDHNGIWVIHWPTNTWTAVERNSKTKYWHPAVYIEPAGKIGPAAAAPAAASTRPARAKTVTARASTPASAPSNARAVVKAKLIATGKPISLRDVSYENAYVIYEYEVVEVVSGQMPKKTIAVAHWHWRGRKMVTASDKTVGNTYTLEVEPYAGHKEFDTEQLANPMPDVYMDDAEACFADVAPLQFAPGRQ